VGWDVGVIKGELPAGTPYVADMIGDPLPVATLAEVNAALAELLPGYTFDPRFGAGWPGCREFALEVYIQFEDDSVPFVSFTPRGDHLRGLQAVFAFARRFDAHVFCFSGGALLIADREHACDCISWPPEKD
jgi:hypothetical protein